MHRKGFTLIELLVVISIIGLLSSVVMASLNSARDKGRLAAGKQFEANMYHVAADQAMGLWDMNDCSGTAVTDSSGNGNAGAFVGGVSFSTNTPTGTGCSVSLDGTGYISMGLGKPAPLSVSAWIYIDPTSPTDERDIFTNWGTSGSNNLVFRTSNKQLGIYANGLAESFNASQVFSVGKWYQVAYVNKADGTNSKLYIDGQEAASVAGTTLGTGTNYWLIGANDSGTARFWKGMIDSVHIYAKTLTASEVRDLYAQGRAAHALARGEENE